MSEPTTRRKAVSKADRELISRIVDRAIEDYGEDRIKAKRMTDALLCAHRAKPIRLNDLLNTCSPDFYHDVINGAYRNYDPKTDTMRKGWTAQHAEPDKEPSWRSILRQLGE